MTIPLAANLGFAVWTLLFLFGSVGVYRWSRILTGRQGLDQFPADRPEGADWYRRAMRAHANCVENLPVFTAIVLVADRIGIANALFDGLAIGVVAARVPQSLDSRCLDRNTNPGGDSVWLFLSAGSFACSEWQP